MGVGVGTLPIRQIHISHNAPHLPPKILRNLCFSFLFCIIAIPREIENNAYAKFCGEGGGGGGKMRCIMGNVEAEVLRTKSS